MMDTLLLDTASWDLVLTVDGDIAVATDPYSLAQDAASACRLFLGELWYNTAKGVPYFEDILGEAPPVALLKQIFETQALTVPGVVASEVFITSLTNRRLTGQVQVTDKNGVLTAADF